MTGRSGDLVREGKSKHFGLSEASRQTIRHGARYNPHHLGLVGR